MKLVKLSIAIKETGSPSREAIMALAKKEPMPKFLYKKDGLWYINISSNAWKEYKKDSISRSLSNTPIECGGFCFRKTKNNKGLKNNHKYQEALKAIAEEKINEARLAEVKADQDEFKFNNMLKSYVDAEYTMNSMLISLGIFRSAIDETLLVIENKFPELKNLYLEGKDDQARMMLINEFQNAFKSAIETIVKKNNE